MKSSRFEFSTHEIFQLSGCCVIGAILCNDEASPFSFERLPVNNKIAKDQKWTFQY